MNRIRIAKQVVHIAEYLLVSPHEEDPDVIVLSRLDSMQRQIRSLLSAIDISTNLAVRIASNVLQRTAARRLLLKTRYRHYRKELVYTPRVRHRLEEREVAEILVGHLLVQFAQLVGHMLLMVSQLSHLTADSPIYRLNLRTSLEINDTMAKHIESLLAYLLSIVPVLQHRAARQLVPYLSQVMHQLMIVLARLEVLRHLRRSDTLQDIKYKHRMMSSKRASTLRDDIRVRNSSLISSLDKSIHTVVDILLNAIVDRTLRIARPRTVIVHAKTTATIHELDIAPHLMKLHIKHRSLLQSRRYTANLSNLAADMEMYKAQAIRQPHLFESLQSAQQLRAVQAKLRSITPTLAPPPTTARSQFYTNAQIRTYPQLGSRVSNNPKLRQLLDHEINTLAHLLSQQSHLDKVLILVSVADN